MAQLLDLGKLRFNFTGVYNPATLYEFNDVAKYGGSSYVYINATADDGNLPTNTQFWARMTDGMQFENTYNPSTQYQLNDLVIYGPQTYIAKSDTVGNLPTNTTYWQLFTEGVGATGSWVTATAYYPGDLVTRGATQYKCTVQHTSSAAFSTDLGTSKWELFVSGVRSRGAWQVATAYLVDDIVSDGVNSYIAIIDHTSGNGLFAQEPAGRWELFVAGSSSLPPQLGEQGKLLTTDGLDGIWTDTISIADLTVDNPSFIGFNAESLATAVGIADPASVFTTDAASTINDHATLAVINGNTNDLSRTDISVYPNDGTEAGGWVRVGIAGSANTGNALVTALDTYVLGTAPVASSKKSNLVLATGTNGQENKIILSSGGVNTETYQAEVDSAGVKIISTTASTSPSTGALRVLGGVGIGGNVNIAGNQSVTGNVTIQGSISVSGGQFVTQSLSSSDPLLFVGAGNPSNNYDLGFMTEAKFAATAYSAKFGRKQIASNIGTLTIATYSVTNRVLTSNIATLTIGTHSFEAGDTITVADVATAFNGDYVITSTDATTISYAKTNTNISSTPSTGTVSFRIRYGDREDLIVGDIIEISGAGAPFDGAKVVKTVSSTAFTFDITNANVTDTVISPAAIGTRNTRAKYSGFSKDNSTGMWHLFSGLAAKPTTSIDFNLGELAYDSIKVGSAMALRGVNVVADATARNAAFTAPVSGTMVYRQDTKIQEVYTGTKWDAQDAIHPFLLMGV